MLLVALAKFNENSQDLPSSSGILAKHAMCPQVKYVKRKPSKPLGASMNVHTLRLQKYSPESMAEKYHRSHSAGGKGHRDSFLWNEGLLMSS